jgi:peptide/nickel transport system permease protein
MLIPALKRILYSVVILFFLITFIFLLLRISPGDPAGKYITHYFNKATIERVKEEFNLDKPVTSQYAAFVKNILRGEFGVSYSFRMPVTDVIKNFLPFTLLLAFLSLLIQLASAFFLTYISYKKKRIEKIISNFAIAAYTVPAFLLALFLILIFSETLRIFPSSGVSSFTVSEKNFFEDFFDRALHLILPLITLSAGGAAVLYKYLFDNLKRTADSNFIIFLRSNGISENKILFKHIFPNAALPLITISGIELGILFSGALITEVIFGLPGMGRLTLNAILVRDYPLVVGAAFTAGALVIAANLIADLLKAAIDKRQLKGI